MIKRDIWCTWLWVCIPPRSQAPRYASPRRVTLHGVHPTAELNCTPRSQKRNLWESLVAFKGTIGRIPFRGKLFYHVRKDWKKKIWIAKTKILTPRCDSHHRVEFFELVIEYLGEIENEFENILACLSGA